VRSTPRVAVAAVGVVIAGLLAGCGVADGGGARPGVAAEVGDTTIRLADVEEAAEDRCRIIEELSGGPDSQPVSGARVRDEALQHAVLREVATQLAEEYGVEPSQLYDDAQTEVRRQLEGVDEELVDRVVDGLTSTDYFVDVLVQVGRDQLGLTKSEDPDGQQGFQRGMAVAQEWLEDHPIETNPRFAAPVIAEDRVHTTRKDLSTAVSNFAKSALGAVEDPQAQDAGYAASLPESQRCG
jgi:hypothetical protein